MARGLGQLSARLPVLGAAGFVFACVFTGDLPARSLELFWVIPLAVFSSVVLTTIHLVIGSFAFWLGETTPLYWVYQKLLFVLGGLMLPLDLYPSAVLAVARFTPFPSLLYAPASLMAGTNTSSVASIAAAQASWLAAIAAFATFSFHRARRKLELNGG